MIPAFSKCFFRSFLPKKAPQIPPRIAPTQVVIVPIQQNKEGVLDKAYALKEELLKAANLLDKLKNQKTYKKEKHKNKFKDED